MSIFLGEEPLTRHPPFVHALAVVTRPHSMLALPYCSFRADPFQFPAFQGNFFNLAFITLPCLDHGGVTECSRYVIITRYTLGDECTHHLCRR